MDKQQKMFLTLGLLYALFSNTMTNSTFLSDSMNYTRATLELVDFEPYRYKINALTQNVQNDPSAMILLTYSLSFFFVAATIWMFAPRRTETVYLKPSYEYEHTENENEYEDIDECDDTYEDIDECDDTSDEDYTDNVMTRKRYRSSSKWKPHPMMLRSMDPAYTLRRSMESSRNHR